MSPMSRRVSRRNFIKAAAAGGAALAGGTTAIPGSAQANQKTPPTSSKLRIELAGYDYDRVLALMGWPRADRGL